MLCVSDSFQTCQELFLVQVLSSKVATCAGCVVAAAQFLTVYGLDQVELQLLSCQSEVICVQLVPLQYCAARVYQQ